MKFLQISHPFKLLCKTHFSFLEKKRTINGANIAPVKALTIKMIISLDVI